MGRKSSVEKLPPEILAEIGRLRQRGQTIDGILAHLQAMPDLPEISRSALGRHIQHLDKYEELIGQSRGLAEALVEKWGDAPDSKAARFNIEMMHALMARMMLSEDGKPAQFDAEEMMFLGRMLKDLASAKKADVETIQKIEERAALTARKAAAAEAVQEARERGVSEELCDAIKNRILNLNSPAPTKNANG